MKRKLFLFMLAALTAAMSAMAEEYIQVSNKKMPFTESWTKSYSYFNDAHSGSISWDASNRKLTLNKFSLWRGWEIGIINIKTCIEIYSTQSVTVEVVGFNKIVNSKGQTFALHGNTTFTGNGTLKLGNNDDKKPGMDLLEENIDITVNGPILKFECSNGGIRGKNNTGTLHLKAGEVQSSSDGKLVTGLANVTFDHGMGVKSPHGAWFSQGLHSLIDVNGNVITSQAVELDTIKYYGFRIHGHEVTENNYDRINQYFGVTEGSVWFSPSTNRLVLDKATINSQTSAPTIDNYDNDGLIIQLIGENTFKFDGVDLKRDAFNLMKNTTIMSFEPGAKLYALRSGIMDIYEHAGIYVYSGKTLTLQNVSLEVAHIAGGNAYTFLNMGDEAYIRFRGGKDKGTVRNINVINKSKCPEVAVNTGSNTSFIWNSAQVPGLYMNKKELLTGGTSLSTQSDVKWYPLSICGHRINSKNYMYISNEYLESGYISYQPHDGTLLLSGVNINYDDQWRTDPAIKFNWSPADANNNVKPYLYICVGNDNIIRTGDAEAINCSGDLHFSKPINVSEEKKLTFIGNNAKIYTREDVTVERVTVSVPELDADILNVKDSKLSITKKLDVNKYVGENEVVASTPEAPAYYDSKTGKVVAPKGPVNFVPSSEVTVYPYKFCGEEINSANCDCVMNKYVKSGILTVSPSIADSYHNDVFSGISCYLYDFQCENTSSHPVFEVLKNDSPQDLQFTLFGNNDFWCREATPFVSDDFYYIGILYEPGYEDKECQLTVHPGSDPHSGEIKIPAEGYFVIQNTEPDKPFSVSVPRIVGGGSSSKLEIPTPYVTVGGNSLGSVKDISIELYPDYEDGAELYYDPSNPCEIKADGIYQKGTNNIYTGQVRFVKNGEGFIPVRSVAIDQQKGKVLTKKGETYQLTATVEPTNASDKSIFWSSSNEYAATVDANGKVKAVGTGTATITASWKDEAFDEYEIRVEIPEPRRIALDQTDVLIDREGIGGFYLTASLTPSNADTEFIWESSDSTLVTVKNDSGQKALVRRVGDEGQATITVKTANGLSASCNVTVHFPITPWYVEFAQRTYTLTEEGEQLKLVPIVTPDNCEKLSFTWYTSSDAISLSNDGTVTARRNGSAVVECWACYDGQKWAPGEVRINVEIPPTPVIATGLKLKGHNSIFHSLGEAFIITPVFTPENVTNQELAWDTTDASVATVDEDGFVTVVGWGDCYITATTTDGSNIKARYSVTAIDPSTIPDPIYATGIRLDENEVTLMRGEQAYIGVTIEPADYNQSVMIEPMEGDVSIAQVDAQWDWNTNRTCIYIRTEEWSEMSGDLKVRVRPNMVDWDKLNEMGIWMEPADTLTIHVLAPIIFAEASPEDINITYHVTDIKDKTCEVYTQPRPGMTMIDPLDPDLIPAVSTTATGKLTVPARANGYWVTHVMPCAFNRCSSLTDIEFSEGIESIGDYACYSGLFSLERVTLPSTIKELGQYCFSANPSDYATSEDPSGRNFIREVNIKSFTPPTGLNGSDINWTGAFQSVAADAVLFVPTGALANYNVEPWTRWFSRIEEKAFFEDEDAIREVESSKLKVESSWFDLSGRKLAGKPTKAGLYIQNGKKIVISRP